MFVTPVWILMSIVGSRVAYSPELADKDSCERLLKAASQYASVAVCVQINVLTLREKVRGS